MPKKPINKYNELVDFCAKNKIILSKNYQDIKINDRTQIYYYCGMCNVEKHKSFKCLTHWKNFPCEVWSNLCDKCFKQTHY
jgi:hypothetical protein